MSSKHEMPDLENIDAIATRFHENGYRLKYDFLNEIFEIWADGNIELEFNNLDDLMNYEWTYLLLKDIMYDEEE